MIGSCKLVKFVYVFVVKKKFGLIIKKYGIYVYFMQRRKKQRVSSEIGHDRFILFVFAGEWRH
jgi:hypothetical protein